MFRLDVEKRTVLDNGCYETIARMAANGISPEKSFPTDKCVPVEKRCSPRSNNKQRSRKTITSAIEDMSVSDVRKSLLTMRSCLAQNSRDTPICISRNLNGKTIEKFSVQLVAGQHAKRHLKTMSRRNAVANAAGQRKLDPRSPRTNGKTTSKRKQTKEITEDETDDDIEKEVFESARNY